MVWSFGIVHLHDGVILLLGTESLRVLLSCASYGFFYLNLTGMTKFKYERKNELNSGLSSSKKTSSCKWPFKLRTFKPLFIFTSKVPDCIPVLFIFTFSSIYKKNYIKSSAKTWKYRKYMITPNNVKQQNWWNTKKKKKEKKEKEGPILMASP